MSIAIVLGLLILSIILFARETLSVDIITLILLVALVVTGILTPAEAFAGFSNPIIITLGSLFVISAALQETGLIHVIGQKLLGVFRKKNAILLPGTMAITGICSAFMNNTTVTALLLSPVTSLAKQLKTSPSGILMPMAFASIVGGTCTLIGTSTNVAVSGFIVQSGMEPVGMFEITPIGLPLLLIAIAYMTFIGKRMLPQNLSDNLHENYSMREYLSEIVVPKNSPLVGQKIFSSELSKQDYRILRVLRDKRDFVPNSRTSIHAGDVLLVEGDVKSLVQVKETAGIEIKADWKLGEDDLKAGDIRIIEGLITPTSPLVNETLKSIRFRQSYDATVLAVKRAGTSIHRKIGEIILRPGDMLLIQCSPQNLEEMRSQSGLAFLGELDPSLYKSKRGFMAASFFLGAIALGTMNIMPIEIALLTAAILCIVFRCIGVERAHQYIDWRLLILIGGMTAFGVAMEKSGAAEWLSNGIIHLLHPLGITAVLAGFFVLTILLTQPMSNAAAALVVLPVALNAAAQLQANPRTFAIGIMIAASISLIAPFEPSCILVYGPGKYKFLDFIRVGAVLTAILAAVSLFLIPLLWPF